MQDYVA